MASNLKDCESAVLTYLLNQNRPYSANDIVLNLHKEHGKTAVQKALDCLVAKDKVKEKLNGKQKAYVINQSDLPTASDQELAELDTKLAAKQAQFKEEANKLKEKEAKLKMASSAMKTEEALSQISLLEKDLLQLDERLVKLSSQKELVTKDEKEKIEQKRDDGVKEWRKRKRMCQNITDAILESYPKSKKALFEEIGIETEAELGIEIPEL